MIKLQVTGIDDKLSEHKFQNTVDYCPFCKTGIKPLVLNAYVNCRVAEIRSRTRAWVIYKCPVNSCGNIFIGVYHLPGEVRLGYCFWGPDSVYPVFPDEFSFSEIIHDISPIFVKIYNQAFFAEQQDLELIAGPGYRKALEFLIKDYTKSISDEADSEEIEDSPLGRVIKNYIDDDRIIEMAKRAAWLGNDETHYLRKWDGKDLDSLKLLIELTTRWIESVELSRKFKEEMPE
jgi:hypothetical protein